MSKIPTVKIKSGEGFIIINESDFDPSHHELCDGEVLSSAHNVTVTLNTETAPELQQAIDEAKTECEKVAAENTWLKEQLATSQGEFIAFKNDVAAMQVRIDELAPKPKKLSAAEVKAAKAAEEAATTEQLKE